MHGLADKCVTVAHNREPFFNIAFAWPPRARGKNTTECKQRAEVARSAVIALARSQKFSSRRFWVTSGESDFQLLHLTLPCCEKRPSGLSRTSFGRLVERRPCLIMESYGTIPYSTLPR